jgi:hypothetical protein
VVQLRKNFCKKVQDKQREKDAVLADSMFADRVFATVVDEADDYVYAGDVSEAIRNSKGEYCV